MSVCIKCGKYWVGDHECRDGGETIPTTRAATALGDSAQEDEHVSLEEVAA